MPRKKKVTTTVEELPEAIVEETEPPTDAELDIEAFVDELGEQAVNVYLSRYVPQRGKYAWLATLPVDEFSLENVARQFGGGRYMARCKDSSGHFFRGSSRVFEIDDSVRPANERAALAGNGASSFERDLLLKLVTERGGGPDIAGQMQAIATIAASQASAMMTAMTPLLAKITELASGGRGESTPIADLVQAIQLGADLGGKDEGYLGVIKDVGVPLVKALETELARKRGVVPALLPQAQPATSGNPSGVPQPPGPPWVPALAPFIPKVLEYAQQGVEPNLVAGILDAQYPRLARWLDDAVDNPAFLGELLAHFPALAGVQAWVERLLAEFGADDEGDADRPFEEGAELPGTTEEGE